MRAIILAAGRGSRMNVLTEDRPKCLVELNGKPLLEMQLSALRKAGIHDIAIVTGYKRELLTNLGLTEFFNPRWAETNMVYSLSCAEAWLSTTPCIVSYSDIFYSPSAVASLMDCTADLAVTYDQNWLTLWSKRFSDPLLDAETFRLDRNGALLEIGNKPRSIDEIGGQYMGLLRFTPRGWAAIQRVRASLSELERDRLHMTGALQRVIESNLLPVIAVPNAEPWGEIDSQEDLAAYCNN